ncbi:hypothetical protein ACVBEE_00930 [Acinetobacter sp. ANC 3781]
MNDKKIFKLLQEWFPVLELREIPKKKYRPIFQQFLAWMSAEKLSKHSQAYLMSVDSENPHENGLEQCAILQLMNSDIRLAQQQISNRTIPLCEHYAKHKQVIGKYYNVNTQVFDIVLEEIYELLKSKKLELIIIYAEKTYWMAVPNEDIKIDKFCRAFLKQFKNEGICIEHYIKLDCLRST